MENARIAAVKTVNYRNLLLQQPLTLDGLSVFIGPNGSGKSNVIAVLEFLKNCIVGASDESQSVSGFENAVALLGGARLLDKAVTPPARVNLQYFFSPPASGIVKPLTFDLTLFVGAKDSKISVAEESLSEPKINYTLDAALQTRSYWSHVVKS
jgi:hypothetical protein